MVMYGIVWYGHYGMVVWYVMVVIQYGMVWYGNDVILYGNVWYDSNETVLYGVYDVWYA